MDIDVIERTWNAAPAKGPLRPVVKVQRGSFWLNLPREDFTKSAEHHFDLIAPPVMGNVTLQIAAKHGLL